MTDNLHQRARAVFLELSTLDGPVASGELDRLVGDDAALRAAVVSLLDARLDANHAGLMTDETRSQLSAPITESAGTIIGPYKILQPIGEGGFGSVFLAEQAQPVRRRVALKIIKLGMDTKQVIARFEAERQALALMDHPHIARVFDAGSTDSGRPYFAMEYVVGDAITKFADDYKLDIDARLKLLAQACSAVQHAHTKGVIHRDLKPANVLVSMVDGRPFAKVIDFGIAKATASPLTNKTLFTEHRQLIGTPEYMSPEQAEGSPDIDTRTDVYALGVLLYELLTGATPFDAARLRSAAWGEMQRIIREEEPPIPSMRLSRDAALSQRTAANRQTEPPRLASSIRGELDWIVMKALDKDRGRRYATPSELAEDIGKHLAGDAVEAAPPSAAYRVKKFVRRHKGPTIATAAVTAVLLLGVFGTTTGLFIAQNSADEAKRVAEVLRGQVASTRKTVQLLALEAVGAPWDVDDDGTPITPSFNDDGFVPLADGAPGMLWVDLDESGKLVGSGLSKVESEDDFGVLLDRLADVATKSIRGRYILTEEAQWSAYTANLALAQNAMDANDWPTARRYLADCPQDKRGWEWSFLRQQACSVTFAVPGFWSTASLTSDGTLRLTGSQEPHLDSAQVDEYSFAVRVDGLDGDGSRHDVVVSLDSRDDRTSSDSKWESTYDRYIGFVQDWNTGIASFLPRGWGYVARDVRPASNDAVLLSAQWDYPHVHVFDTNKNNLTGRYHFGESDPQIITVSDDQRWLLAIDRPDGDSWRDRYCRAILIDIHQAGSPEHFLGSGDYAAMAIADVVGEIPSHAPDQVVLRDGSRRITVGSARELHFFDASSDDDPLRQRLVARIPVPAAVQSLYLSDDQRRLILKFADGSASLWDIRDPKERRSALEREWSERTPASGYIYSLLTADTTSSLEGLEDAITADDSISHLRRQVSIEILRERFREYVEDARIEFERLVPGQTNKSELLSIADSLALEPRTKAALKSRIEKWTYVPPEPSAKERLAKETRQRELAEQALQLRSYAYWIEEAQASWERGRYDTANAILDLCPESLRGVEWDTLREWCNVRSETFAAHDGPISALAFSDRDIGRLASAGHDLTLKTWDCESKPPKQLRSVEGLDERVLKLAFTPDGQFLLSVGDAAGVVVRDGDTLEVIRTLGEREGQLTTLAIDEAGAWCAAGTSDGRILVWDLATNELIHELHGHDAAVTAMYKYPFRTLLASGDASGWLMMWDPETGRRLEQGTVRLGDDEPYAITALGMDSEGNVIAGPRAGRSRDDGVPPIALSPELPGVLELSMVAYDSEELGSFEVYRAKVNPYVWYGEGGYPEPGYDWQQPIPADRPILSQGLAASRDGRWLAAGHDDGSIRLSRGWHSSIPRAPRSVWNSIPGASDDGFRAQPIDGALLLHGSAGLLNIPIVQEGVQAWIRADRDIKGIAAASSGNTWVLLRMENGSLKLLDARTNEYVNEWDLSGRVQFAPSGDWFIQVNDGEIRVRSVPDGAELRSFPLPLAAGAELTKLTVSPDGRLVGFATLVRSPDRETYPFNGIRGGYVGVVDAFTGDLLWISREFSTMRFMEDTLPLPISQIVFDPRSERLLVGATELAMFDARSGLELGSVAAATIDDVCFAEGGTRFFTSRQSSVYGRPNQVLMWDSDTMTRLQTWNVEQGEQLFLAPTGTELLTLGWSDLDIIPFHPVRGARPSDASIEEAKHASEIATKLEQHPPLKSNELDAMISPMYLTPAQRSWIRDILASRVEESDISP